MLNDHNGGDLKMNTLEVPVVDFKRRLSDYVSRSQHNNTRVIRG